MSLFGAVTVVGFEVEYVKKATDNAIKYLRGKTVGYQRVSNHFGVDCESFCILSKD